MELLVNEIKCWIDSIRSKLGSIVKESVGIVSRVAPSAANNLPFLGRVEAQTLYPALALALARALL